MIVLDTNVISEMFRGEKDPNVRAWMFKQDPESVYLTATTLAELNRGVERLSVGRKRDAIANWIEIILRQSFAGRILPFDETAAILWGELMGRGDKNGRPRPPLDTQIAAVALSHGFELATRNTSDFDGVGLTLINPWQRTD